MTDWLDAERNGTYCPGPGTGWDPLWAIELAELDGHPPLPRPPVTTCRRHHRPAGTPPGPPQPGPDPADDPWRRLLALLALIAGECKRKGWLPS